MDIGMADRHRPYQNPAPLWNRDIPFFELQRFPKLLHHRYLHFTGHLFVNGELPTLE